MISKHLNKNNLHHAYLIEGEREEILPGLLEFIESLGIKTSSNPDFYHMFYNSFKIEDAHNLKSIQYEKSFSVGKKIFLISANNFLLEAQNILLKIFEEPIKDTHFFIIVPDVDILLKTLTSRFYLIRAKSISDKELENAKKFIKMPLKNRLDFIKELLTEQEGHTQDSVRSKALKFLNALEKIMSTTVLDINFSFKNCFTHIFKVREFLNQPGSSAKSLMESVALIIPNF